MWEEIGGIEMAELKSCPFCGSNDIKPIIYSCVGNLYQCECDNCGTLTGKYDTEKEAIAAWNTRAEPEPRVLTAEWINSKDMLPKFGTDVLVYSDSCKKIFKAYFHKAWWCFSYDNSPIRENVTHWMSLPQPPKE